MSVLRIPPSSAHIWGSTFGCTGWPEMSAQFPRVDNPKAAEGRAAHELLAALVEFAVEGGNPSTNRKFTVGQEVASGVICTDEMFDAVLDCVTDFMDVYNGLVSQGLKPTYGIETEITAARIHPDLKGRVDLWLYVPRNEGHLYVWDFKYGHAVVEAHNSWQNICYATGKSEDLKLGAKLDTWVHMRIVQPRAYHIKGISREWLTSLKVVLDHAQIMHDRAAKIFAGEGKTNTGDHCKYCTARHVCGEAQRAAMLAVEYSGNPVPEPLDNEALGLELRTLQRASTALKSRVTGLEAQAETLIRQGQIVPGFKLIPAKGREAWTKPDGQVMNLGKMYGVDVSTPKLITPKQARNAGIDAEVVAEYAAYPDGGHKLTVTNSDEAKQTFSQSQNEDLIT